MVYRKKLHSLNRVSREILHGSTLLRKVAHSELVEERRVLLPFIRAVNYLVFWRRRIKVFTFFVIFIGYFSGINAHESLHKAVVVVPVADLIGQPIKSLFPHQSAESIYNQIPLYSEDIADNHACARIHQLLFNEIVEIVETRGDEMCVKIPNMFYITHNPTQPHTIYWMHKKALIPLHDINRTEVDMSKFPKPINYRLHDIGSCNKNTITLKEPFYDSVTKQTYSAGTRFVCSNTQTVKHKQAVHIFDTKDQLFKVTHIPEEQCATTPQTEQESIDMFIDILKQWAHQKNNKSIPYVWGGCSFVTTHNVDKAVKTHKDIDEKKSVTFYTIPPDKNNIKTGLDCTGMVARAAQIAGIPYFFKNSTTVKQYVKPLKQNESLSIGDILWIPGHVMVVSDIKNNRIIEARAYDHGYGKIQEISLDEQFRNMHTFADLTKAIAEKKSIERLDKQGNTIKKITNMQILKLSSAWDK